MRKQVFALLTLISCLAVSAGCRRTPEGPGNQKGTALPLPRGTPKRPQGTAALIVKPKAAQPISKADVVAYFKTHNLPKNMGSVNQFHVDSVEFLTNSEVIKRLQGASPGLDDNDRVAFVTLIGQFIFTGPQSRAVVFRRAYAVFDASSGNLLMVGTLERLD